MNEEERIIRSIKYIINQNYVDTEDDIIGILIKALNLIEKQSKEIEEFKNERNLLKEQLDYVVNEYGATIEKQDKKLKEIEAIVDTTPYVAYTSYGDILYESDEILEIIRSDGDE